MSCTVIVITVETFSWISFLRSLCETADALKASTEIILMLSEGILGTEAAVTLIQASCAAASKSSGETLLTVVNISNPTNVARENMDGGRLGTPEG